MDQHSIDPALFERADTRALLARRDISALYAALKVAGISQRRIAVLTGQSQSEVSEILKGRVVSSYDGRSQRRCQPSWPPCTSGRSGSSLSGSAKRAGHSAPTRT